MPGPGEYRPDPTIGIARTEDLPKTKVSVQSRNYRRRPCPHCGRRASRDRLVRRVVARPLERRHQGRIAVALDLPQVELRARARRDCPRHDVARGELVDEALAAAVEQRGAGAAQRLGEKEAVVPVAVASLFLSSYILLGIAGAINVIVDALVNPVLQIAVVLIYFDLRVRREGLDLFQMAHRLAARPATS